MRAGVNGILLSIMLVGSCPTSLISSSVIALVNEVVFIPPKINKYTEEMIVAANRDLRIPLATPIQPYS